MFSVNYGVTIEKTKTQKQSTWLALHAKIANQSVWLALRALRALHAKKEHTVIPPRGTTVSISRHKWDPDKGPGAANFQIAIHYESAAVPLVSEEKLLEWLRQSLCADASHPVITISSRKFEYHTLLIKW